MCGFVHNMQSHLNLEVVMMRIVPKFLLGVKLAMRTKEVHIDAELYLNTMPGSTNVTTEEKHNLAENAVTESSRGTGGAPAQNRGAVKAARCASTATGSNVPLASSSARSLPSPMPK